MKQSHRSSSTKINNRYSRIDLSNYQEIIDRRESKRESILNEMMQECTFKPLLSQRSLLIDATSARSSAMRTSKS